MRQSLTRCALITLASLLLVTGCGSVEPKPRGRIDWSTLDYRHYDRMLRDNDADYVPPATISICGGDQVNPNCR